MNVMKHKGYTAHVEFDAEDRIFVGHLVGVRDIVGFHGSTVDELEQAFRAVVDDYLVACEQLGQKPNRPVSGKILLRVAPEVHAAAVAAAEAAGQSLNQWATAALQKAVND